MGASEPSFCDTAGVTTADTTAVWTSLGVVGNFTGGSAPHARLASVFGANWFASGNTVYIGDNHAEAAIHRQSRASSSALLARILCHNHSGSYPPAASDLTTGARYHRLAASSRFAMQGSFYFRGITLVCGRSAAVRPPTSGRMRSARFRTGIILTVVHLQFTSTQCRVLQVGSNSAAAWAVIIFNNTTVKFAAVTQYISAVVCQFHLAEYRAGAGVRLVRSNDR